MTLKAAAGPFGDRAVDKIGTLVIRRQLDPPGRSSRPLYTITFQTSPTERDAPAYRCHGDFALLRTLEELLASPELRLETLERVRDRGEAVIREVSVPDSVIAKYEFAARPRREALSRFDHQMHVTERPCTVCSLPTTPNDRLTMLSGDVVHYDCRPESRDMTAVAARFLAESEGRMVCHSCLAALLGVSFDEARKVVGQLRARHGLTVDTGRCSVCGKYRVTLGLSVTQEQRLDSAAASEVGEEPAAGDHAGP
jgi:hypothetical protein